MGGHTLSEKDGRTNYAAPWKSSLSRSFRRASQQVDMPKALTIWRERIGMNDRMTPLNIEIQPVVRRQLRRKTSETQA
jgi:hypothetical protein